MAPEQKRRILKERIARAEDHLAKIEEQAARYRWMIFELNEELSQTDGQNSEEKAQVAQG